jgi:hypothetical protein
MSIVFGVLGLVALFFIVMVAFRKNRKSKKIDNI